MRPYAPRLDGDVDARAAVTACDVTGPIEATTVWVEQIGGLILTEDVAKARTAEGLVKRHHVDAVLEQHPIDVGPAAVAKRSRRRPCDTRPLR